MIIKFLTSLRLTLVLFLFIGLFSAFSTLIPQGREAAYYIDNYGERVAGLILAIDFHKFFRSFLFLAPLALFYVNLLSCTIKRLYKRFRSKTKHRFGPDIVHIGILLLILGGVINLFGRQEGFIWLSPGQEIRIIDDWSLKLDSFEFQLYPDGRPKDWISHVGLLRNGVRFRTDAIEVNKPLKMKNLKLFQSSYYKQGAEYLTGISIVKEPGYYIIFISLLILTFGLMITYIQKLKER